MKKLDQHNELQTSRHMQMYSGRPVKNGIECPRCRSELLDSNPHMTLTSMPPQKNVHCNDCGFVGYRVS